jgi:cytochrome P450
MKTAFTASSFNPHAPEFLANPYPTYRYFRDNAPIAPVFYTLENNEQTPMGMWVFRYEDVRTVLDQKDLYLKNEKASPPVPGNSPIAAMANMPNGLFSMDPPRHGEVRPILDELFAASILNIETVVRNLADQYLDRLKGGQSFDLFADYAMPLPSQVLREVLGIPDGHWGGIESWVGRMVSGHDITTSVANQFMAGTCTMALGGYYQAMQKGCPFHAESGKMFDQMVNAGEARGILPEEVQQTAVNLSLAGYLTSVFLIATGVYNLLTNPKQLALLRSRPELIGNAVEEMLRIDAPAQLVDRVVCEDTELGGVHLKAGTKVTAALGSANHDPLKFHNPETFDIERDTTGHLGFGEGIHTCLGAPLLRKVAPIAIECLLNEFPNLHINGTPQWQTDPYLRSVSNLPVAI